MNDEFNKLARVMDELREVDDRMQSIAEVLHSNQTFDAMTVTSLRMAGNLAVPNIIVESQDEARWCLAQLLKAYEARRKELTHNAKELCVGVATSA